jgi:hypothetical protein
MQPIYEASFAPGKFVGERTVEVYDESFPVQMRVLCSGSGLGLKANVSKPAILMEVGGGAGGGDLMYMQKLFE